MVAPAGLRSLCAGGEVQTNRRPRGTQPVIQEEGEPVPTPTTPPPSKTGGESRKTVAILLAQAALFLRAPWNSQGHKQRGEGRVRRKHGIVLLVAEKRVKRSKLCIVLRDFNRVH